MVVNALEAPFLSRWLSHSVHRACTRLCPISLRTAARALTLLRSLVAAMTLMLRSSIFATAGHVSLRTVSMPLASNVGVDCGGGTWTKYERAA